MVWANEKDELLCREILLLEPYIFKPRSRERGNAWKDIAEALNKGSTEDLYFRVDARAVRERFTLLLTHFQAKEKAEINATGISPEPTPLEEALQHIAERVAECEVEQENNDKKNNEKVEKDKQAAVDIRKKAMETFAETKARKKVLDDDEDDSPKTEKKRRSSGSDTLQYLREKSENDHKLRLKEMELQKQDLALREQQMLMSQQQTQQLLQVMMQLMQQKQ